MHCSAYYSAKLVKGTLDKAGAGGLVAISRAHNNKNRAEVPEVRNPAFYKHKGKLVFDYNEEHDPYKITLALHRRVILFVLAFYIAATCAFLAVRCSADDAGDEDAAAGTRQSPRHSANDGDAAALPACGLT